MRLIDCTTRSTSWPLKILRMLSSSTWDDPAACDGELFPTAAATVQHRLLRSRRTRASPSQAAAACWRERPADNNIASKEAALYAVLCGFSYALVPHHQAAPLLPTKQVLPRPARAAGVRRPSPPVLAAYAPGAQPLPALRLGAAASRWYRTETPRAAAAAAASRFLAAATPSPCVDRRAPSPPRRPQAAVASFPRAVRDSAPPLSAGSQTQRIPKSPAPKTAPAGSHRDCAIKKQLQAAAAAETRSVFAASGPTAARAVRLARWSVARPIR